MNIRFYNTLTHRVDPFTPIHPPQVFMYNCGPTVYDFAHIGNFRAFLFADLLRRFLETTDHHVYQVMNITDVGHMTDDQQADGGGEDKMQLASRRLKEAKKSGVLPPGTIENPDDPYQVAGYFTQAFLDDARKLNLRIAGEYPSHMPKATDYVGRMIEIILRLVDQGHAYRAGDGCVYFDVQSFPDYGRLSGNTLDKLRSGAGGRVSDQQQAVKKHPADFLLWKPDSSHIMKWDPHQWDAPWGVGYPGWHIECSAMSRHVLSQLAGRPLYEIDIHTGAEDNIFPHHECEIAQSVCSTPSYDAAQHTGRSFSRFWMHARFLLVDGQKMSKSKGNFYTVRDVLEGKVTGQTVDPAVLRYELIKVHYRSNLNFTVKGLQDSASAIQRLRDAFTDADRQAHATSAPQELAVDQHSMVVAFTQALADDLNISGALAEVFKWLGDGSEQPAVRKAVLMKIDEVLGVLGSAGAGQGASLLPEPDDFADQRSAALDAARKAKDFATADRLRKELQDAGYEVMTTKQGTTARKKLA